MLDLGWQEFILIALVALVVVGPKDLPRVIRSVSQWVRKARSLASEFQGSLEEMAREAELDDVRRQIQNVSREGVGAAIEKHVDPGGEIRRSVEDAKASSGIDAIEGAVRETEGEARALSTETKSALDYASKVAEVKIPGNSVTPPAPAATPAVTNPAPPSTTPVSTTPTTPAPKKTTRKAPAAKRSTTKSASARSPAEPAAKPANKPAARPRKTAAKPAGSGEA